MPASKYKHRVVFTELFNLDVEARTTKEYIEEYIDLLDFLIEFTNNNMISWSKSHRYSGSVKTITFTHNISTLANKSGEHNRLEFIKNEDDSTYIKSDSYKFLIYLNGDKHDASLNITNKDIKCKFEELFRYATISNDTSTPLKNVINVLNTLAETVIIKKESQLDVNNL